MLCQSCAEPVSEGRRTVSCFRGLWVVRESVCQAGQGCCDLFSVSSGIKPPLGMARWTESGELPQRCPYQSYSPPAPALWSTSFSFPCLMPATRPRLSFYTHCSSCQIANRESTLRGCASGPHLSRLVRQPKHLTWRSPPRTTQGALLKTTCRRRGPTNQISGPDRNHAGLGNCTRSHPKHCGLGVLNGRIPALRVLNGVSLTDRRKQ